MLDLAPSGDNWELEERSRLVEAYSLARELERRRCEEDFSFFARQAWHTVEPGIPYVHGPHIEAIVDHLDACLPRVHYEPKILPGGRVTQVRVAQPGQIRKLLINMPFRHMKSTLVSVLWPAFVWTQRPEFRWLFSSYALSLATRDTMRMRVVLMSPWYQGLWAAKFRLLADQNRKDKFFNTSMGYRITASRDSGATGEGGDIVVCDDPHNVREADSTLMRETTAQWWFESMSSRKNDPNLSAEVVVGQRVHKDDLSARCKAKGYEVLELPARYDPKRTKVTCIGWGDWRSKEGELLWPQRFSEQAMVDTENSLGPFGVACQLQQNPQPRGGAFIQRDWFKRISAEDMKLLHGSIVWVRTWDLALVKTGHRNASVEMGQDADGITYIRRGLYWRDDWANSLAQIKIVGHHEKNWVVVESIGTTKSAGEDVERELLGKCYVEVITDKVNKVSEAIAWVAAAKAGQIKFVEEDLEEWPFFEYNSGPWIEHFLDIFASWIPDPALDQDDDEIDAVSMGWAATRGKVPLDNALSDLGFGSNYDTDPGGFR